jgi:hypothetical protein
MFVIFTNDHNKKPILVNTDHIRSAHEVAGHNAIPAQAFTDFDVESLVELIKIHRESTPTRER